jgi:hypothetical protein
LEKFDLWNQLVTRVRPGKSPGFGVEQASACHARILAGMTRGAKNAGTNAGMAS